MRRMNERQMVTQGFRKISYRECLMKEQWDRLCPRFAQDLAGSVKDGVLQAWINTHEQVRYTLTDLGKACLRKLCEDEAVQI